MDENLERELIGQKADKMYNKVKKTGSFNIFAFFFTGIYFLYRKMYLTGIVLVLIMMIPFKNIDNGVYVILNIIFHLIIGFLFYPLYNKHIENQVNKIKQETTEQEEMKNLCQKRGGTSILAAFIPFIIVFVLMLFSSSLIMMNAIQVI